MVITNFNSGGGAGSNSAYAWIACFSGKGTITVATKSDKIYGVTKSEPYSDILIPVSQSGTYSIKSVNYDGSLEDLSDLATVTAPHTLASSSKRKASLTKSFSELSTTELLTIVKGLDSGSIVCSDLNWKVGDKTNVIKVGSTAMPFVILDTGANANYKFIDGSTVNYLLGLYLSGPDISNKLTGNYHSMSSNDKIYYEITYGNKGTDYSACASWRTSDMRLWSNGTFYNSIDYGIRPIFKKFITLGGEWYISSIGGSISKNSPKMIETEDYFAVPATVEYAGSDAPHYNPGSTEALEYNSLKQFAYYANNKSNRNPTDRPLWTRTINRTSGWDYYSHIIESNDTVTVPSESRGGYFMPFGCI